MIFITGASGAMGCALVKELYNQGERHLRVLINRSNHLSTFMQDMPCAGLQIDYVQGSLTNIDCLYEALRDVTHIYHLAGLVSIFPSADKAMHEVNVTGTTNLLKVAAEYGVKKVVYLSSIEALGYMLGETLIDETVGFRPDKTFMTYGKSKALGALEALYMAQAADLPLVILIPGGIIGPYDYGLSHLGKVLFDISRGKLSAYLNGALDLVDNRDMAVLCHTAMQQGEAYQSYLCSGTHISMEQLVVLTARLAKRKIPPKLSNSLAKMVATFFELRYKKTGGNPLITHEVLSILQTELNYDNSKARRELGWCNRPLEETIADTLMWFSIFFPSKKA